MNKLLYCAWFMAGMGRRDRSVSVRLLLAWHRGRRRI